MNNELKLLVCCMVNEDWVGEGIALGLTDECFTNRDYRHLWSGMVEQKNRGLSCDQIWSVAYLKDFCGKDYTLTFTDALIEVQNPMEFTSAVEIVLKDYRRSQLAETLARHTQQLEVGEPILLTDSLITELSGFKNHITVPQTIDVESRVREKLDKKNIVRTGIPRLTWMTKGIERGVLLMLGGFTSHGKSQLALNISLKVAEQEQPVTFFSTEMDETSLTMRLATVVSGINPSLMLSMTEVEKDAFMTDVSKIKEYPIEICKTLSLPNIRMAIQKRKSLLYVVDYIQMIYPAKPIDNEVRRLGYIVRELETMSKDYNVCILATSQFHRPARKDGEALQPTLSSYRGSGEIEENTDIGLLLYYPYVMASFDKKREMEKEGKDREVELCVSKNRIHGLTGVIELDFDRNSMRFKQQSDGDDTPFD